MLRDTNAGVQVMTVVCTCSSLSDIITVLGGARNHNCFKFGIEGFLVPRNTLGDKSDTCNHTSDNVYLACISVYISLVGRCQNPKTSPQGDPHEGPPTFALHEWSSQVCTCLMCLRTASLRNVRQRRHYCDSTVLLSAPRHILPSITVFCFELLSIADIAVSQKCRV